MSLIRSIHHVQFACKDLSSLCQKFTHGFGYQLYCAAKHGQASNVVLKSGNSSLLFSHSNFILPPAYSSYQLPSNSLQMNRPFNVALDSLDVHRVCENVRSFGSDVLLDPITVSDTHGTICMAVIRSCLPGVLHTLVDTSNYHGPFLPGYNLHDSSSNFKSPSQSMIDHVDHVVLACHTGQSENAIDWYAKVFGLTRSMTNKQDAMSDGFVIKHGQNGLRLKALCRGDDSEKSSTSPFTFVFVESLKDSVANQISRFLDANGGPGIQHIGLYVKDIFGAVKHAQNAGIDFLDPPEAYYNELSSLHASDKINLDFDELKKSGVLLDADVHSANRSNGQLPLLLQIFTQSLFIPDAFFVELIQRVGGATGFGEGNITALWRAVEAATSDKQSK